MVRAGDSFLRPAPLAARTTGIAHARASASAPASCLKCTPACVQFRCVASLPPSLSYPCDFVDERLVVAVVAAAAGSAAAAAAAPTATATAAVAATAAARIIATRLVATAILHTAPGAQTHVHRHEARQRRRSDADPWVAGSVSLLLVCLRRSFRLVARAGSVFAGNLLHGVERLIVVAVGHGGGCSRIRFGWLFGAAEQSSKLRSKEAVHHSARGHAEKIQTYQHYTFVQV